MFRDILIGIGLLMLVGGGGVALTGYQEMNSMAASIERGAGALADILGKASPIGNLTNEGAKQKIQIGAVLASIGVVMLVTGILTRKE